MPEYQIDKLVDWLKNTPIEEIIPLNYKEAAEYLDIAESSFTTLLHRNFDCDGWTDLKKKLSNTKTVSGRKRRVTELYLSVRGQRFRYQDFIEKYKDVPFEEVSDLDFRKKMARDHGKTVGTINRYIKDYHRKEIPRRTGFSRKLPPTRKNNEFGASTLSLPERIKAKAIYMKYSSSQRNAMYQKGEISKKVYEAAEKGVF